MPGGGGGGGLDGGGAAPSARPFYTLAIHEPLDWWVLLAFLITGMVAAELFYRTQRAVALAERVEALREADRLKDALLATVSHEALMKAGKMERS